MEISWIGSIIGAVVAGLIGFFTSNHTIKKNDEATRKRIIDENKLILLNQLAYSVGIYKDSLDLLQGKSTDKMIKENSLIIENNWKDSLRYLDLSIHEKKSIMEWMEYLNQTNMFLERQALKFKKRLPAIMVWKETESEIGRQMDELLPVIDDIIKKLKQ